MPSNLNFTEEGFSNIVIRNEKNIVQLRTNAFDDDEALRWKEVFTARNSTTFNAARLYHGVRYRFHEKFICLRGDKRHKGVKKTYTGCSVKMDIKIKLITKNTIRIDKDVRTHPCTITIEGTHNHPTKAPSALQELRIPTATTDTFFKYFDLGMTVPQAIRFHREKLNFNLSDLANAAVNPKSRSVYYMREKWLKNNYGTLGGGDMFSAIKKYADANPLSKIKYEHTGERFTLVLITDFMSTVHREFREAGEVIFVDTTSHFDQLNTAVTPLLCAGPAGALPLGVIFTSSQDEASYTAGFDMLKQMLGDSAFYQQGHPLCFITDNSDAERNALRKVWPNSERYLCIFHILQQVWRWLCDSSHGVKKDHRQLLIYVTNLIQRKEEWCILYRAGRLLRGNQTNNYAEATMCIIKDIILNRCKAFNTSQLLMFMNEVFDLYMKQRLLDVALGRKKSRVPAYNSISQDIIRCNDDEYKMFVKSQSEDTVTYTVDLRLGICDCTMGNTGKVCKHQVACSEKFLLALPQIFSSTPEKRQWLARIALGNENVPSLEFFATLHDNSEQFQSDCVKECDKNTQATAYRHNEDSDGTQMPSTTFQHNNTNSDDTQMPSTVHCNNKNKFEKSTDSDDDDCKTSNPKRRSKQIMEKLDILTETIKHSAALYGDELTVGDIEKLTNRFRNVRTSDQLHSLFQCTGAALPCVGRGKIPCQPTSIARRQQGMPRGAAPITKGRKRKGNLIHKTLKRQRNLSLNISQNVMNAKSHGSDH